MEFQKAIKTIIITAETHEEIEKLWDKLESVNFYNGNPRTRYSGYTQYNCIVESNGKLLKGNND